MSGRAFDNNVRQRYLQLSGDDAAMFNRRGAR
jgi:hypothetical protein